jgi:hypothetical protein
MKQIETSRKKAKPLWYWAVCPETGKGCLFRSEGDFYPRAGAQVPAKEVSDWAEEGAWVVEVIFDLKFQRMMSVWDAVDHYADDGVLGGVTMTFSVLEKAIGQCVTAACRKNRRLASALPINVTVEFLQQISAPNSTFIIMTGNAGETPRLMPASVTIQLPEGKLLSEVCRAQA